MNFWILISYLSWNSNKEFKITDQKLIDINLHFTMHKTPPTNWVNTASAHFVLSDIFSITSGSLFKSLNWTYHYVFKGHKVMAIFSSGGSPVIWQIFSSLLLNHAAAAAPQSPLFWPFRPTSPPGCCTVETENIPNRLFSKLEKFFLINEVEFVETLENIPLCLAF